MDELHILRCWHSPYYTQLFKDSVPLVAYGWVFRHLVKNRGWSMGWRLRSSKPQQRLKTINTWEKLAGKVDGWRVLLAEANCTLALNRHRAPVLWLIIILKHSSSSRDCKCQWNMECMKLYVELHVIDYVRNRLKYADEPESSHCDIQTPILHKAGLFELWAFSPMIYFLCFYFSCSNLCFILCSDTQ